MRGRRGRSSIAFFFFVWGVGVDVREKGTVGDRVVKIYRTWPIHRIMHKDENMPNIYNMS